MNIPASAPVAFSCQGFYEDFWIEGRFLGCRTVAWPDRAFGSPGQLEVALTENMTLRRGLKEVKLSASKDKPVKCYAVLNIKCGPQLRAGDVVKVLRSESEKVTSLAPAMGKIESILPDGRAALSHGRVEWNEEAWRLQLMERPHDEWKFPV